MFNRMKHLQEDYAQYFNYDKKTMSFKVNSKV